MKYGKFEKVIPLSDDVWNVNLAKLPSPELMMMMENGDIPKSNDFDELDRIKNQVVKSLQKRNYQVFDSALGYTKDDNGQPVPQDFIIEFFYKGKIVLLNGYVTDQKVSRHDIKR